MGHGVTETAENGRHVGYLLRAEGALGRDGEPVTTLRSDETYEVAVLDDDRVEVRAADGEVAVVPRRDVEFMTLGRPVVSAGVDGSVDASVPVRSWWVAPAVVAAITTVVGLGFGFTARDAPTWTDTLVAVGSASVASVDDATEPAEPTDGEVAAEPAPGDDSLPFGAAPFEVTDLGVVARDYPGWPFVEAGGFVFVNPNSLWGEDEPSIVAVLDADTGAELTRIEISAGPWEWVRDAAVTDHGIVLAFANAPHVAVFDPGCLCLDRTIPLGGFGAAFVHATGNTTVVVDDIGGPAGDYLLTQMDVATGQVVSSEVVFESAGSQNGMVGIVEAGNWLVSASSRGVWAFDSAAPHELLVKTAFAEPVGYISEPVYANGSIFVADHDNGVLIAVDTTTLETEFIEVATSSFDLLNASNPVVDTRLGLVWISAPWDDLVLALDPVSWEVVHRIELTEPGVRLRTGLDHVWAQNGSEIVAIDPETGRPLRVDVDVQGGQLMDIVGNTLWIGLEEGYHLHELAPA